MSEKINVPTGYVLKNVDRYVRGNDSLQRSRSTFAIHALDYGYRFIVNRNWLM